MSVSSYSLAKRPEALLLVAMLPVTIGSCSEIKDWRHPEIAACRSYIQAGLRAPSTYSEQSNSTAETSDGSIRTVSIVYDAANAFGTPIRGAEQCKFSANPSNGKIVGDPNFSATMAKADRALGGQNGCCQTVNTARGADASPEPENAVTDSSLESPPASSEKSTEAEAKK